MKRFLSALAVVGLATSLGMAANAAPTLVTNLGALGANDSLDWGVLGPEGTIVSNPFTTNSAGGISVTGSEGGGNFERLDEGTSFGGNFSPGDHLLYTATALGGGIGPVTLTFGQSVSGAGFNIQNNFYGTFNATISAFDSANNLLGTVTEMGNSTSDNNGSAIFIGVLNSSADISSIKIETDDTFGVSGSANDFAINTLHLNTSGGNPVPEASTVLGFSFLLSMGGATFLRARRNAAK